MTGKPIDGIAPADAPAGFDQAHRTLLADPSIQFDLPMFEPRPPPDWMTNLFAGDAPVLRALFWLVVAAVAALVLWRLLRWAADRDWRRRRAAEEESWRPEEAPARALLGEADALAAQGRFGEAAHLLLFRSLEDIEARRPALLRPALTSRDIAALPALPERPRGAFARIAGQVERSLFARRPLAEQDWRECRAAYEEFAFAEGWSG